MNPLPHPPTKKLKLLTCKSTQIITMFSNSPVTLKWVKVTKTECVKLDRVMIMQTLKKINNNKLKKSLKLNHEGREFVHYISYLLQFKLPKAFLLG